MTSVSLDYPGAASMLVHRVPKYLRFTTRMVDGKQLWDALDQLDDESTPDEVLLAAKLVRKGNVHVDGVRKGKRFSEWIETARYVPLEPQPSQDVMRSTSAWQKFCLDLQATGKGESV